VHVLKKYNLWGKVPETVREHLRKGMRDPCMETLKAEDFEGFRFHNIVLADNNVMCEAAKKKLKNWDIIR
jgi:glycerate 2-kinase